MTDHHDDGRSEAGSGPETPRWVEGVRARYNTPPEPPRDEMWNVVRLGLAESGVLSEAPEARGTVGAGDASVRGDDVLEVARARRRREVAHRPRPRHWAWATAAAAVLAVGIGIGRWSVAVPDGDPAPVPVAVETRADPDGSGVELAARLHFGRTESLLATVRSDARTGRMDDSVGPWARSLLAQTRLLMDARGGTRDETQRLLSDLELVLVQILGATEVGTMDTARAREELDMAVRSLEQGELLTRIRSAAPTVVAGA